jgi:hypothetical protein
MKIDPRDWAGHSSGAKAELSQPSVHVKLAKPGAVYVHHGKLKTLVGYGTEMKFSTPLPASISANAEFYVKGRQNADTQTLGEPFTNVDKRPGSTVEQAVSRELTLLRNARLKLRQDARKQRLEEELKRVEAGAQEKLSEKAEEIKADMEEEKEREVIDAAEAAE